MATFIEAMKWLSEGKRVTQPWLGDVFFSTRKAKVIGFQRDKHPAFLPAYFTQQQTRANDWKLYESPVRYFDGAEAIRLMKEGKTVMCGGHEFSLRDNRLYSYNRQIDALIVDFLVSERWHLAKAMD